MKYSTPHGPVCGDYVFNGKAYFYVNLSDYRKDDVIGPYAALQWAEKHLVHTEPLRRRPPRKVRN